MNALSAVSSNTLYRLGLWYGVYRLIISFSLLLIFFLTFNQLKDNYSHIGVYFFTLLVYAFLGTLQLLMLRLFPTVALPRQLLLISLIDVTCFGALTFAIGGPNLHIGLLFVITIFVTNLLLSRRQALSITLASTIAVLYLQLFGSWFSASDLSNIGNSILLAFLFFVVYLTGQFAVQRFRLLENISISQSLELLQLQNINRYILEQIDMGYLAIDEEMNVVLSNPAAYNLLGIPTLLVFRPAPLQEIQPDLYQYLSQNVVNQGERFIFETMQSRYGIHIRVQKLELPQQTLTLFIMQDAQKLNQQVQQLKLAALGQLSASIAHEIRNPLASIVQANALFIDAEPEQQHMLTGMIQKQAKRIDHIIQSTLNMARNQATVPTDIALEKFLPQLIVEDLNESHQKIHVEIPNPVLISFDESQFRQVLINLIRNALRHNSPEHPQIHVYAYQQEDYAYIDVIDFGEGISADKVHNLFNPFFTTQIDGTGLGLYLSRSFCEANQAKLSYIKLQDGTCFRVECPAIQIQ